MLGTGTPFADPHRMGPCLAVVVNNAAYIVDCGPGIVRRASAAYQEGITALGITKLRHLFITHLHSDHTAGLADFILTPAVLDRPGPIEIYGPKGIKEMSCDILKAYQKDIDIRVKGLEHDNAGNYALDVHEISPGFIYKDSNILVKAFRVIHGSWDEAYGFRFETKDKVIVVSGDCTYSKDLIENAKGCDILVHEVYSMKGLSKKPLEWQKYHASFHTSSKQLAEIANVVKPRLLVLTHELLWTASEEELLNEVKASYKGEVRSAEDLDVFNGSASSPHLLHLSRFR